MGKRSIKIIAKEIRKNWKKVNYAAEPYLAAMETINDINDNYFNDSAYPIVNYFLVNASGWRGDTARKIKLELN
jgi:hypothetical protein